ncbi:MAG: aminomethyl transferase family protein [Alphaproteobacteria bacterium]|nr:aminomethyl transferase family protein [Alphaproteobacteria bacterium]
MTDLEVLREGVVIADLGPVELLRLEGTAAWDVLDRVLPCDLFLRDGQAKQTMWLDPVTGEVLADVLVLADGDVMWLLVDGLPAARVAEVLAAEARAGEELSVELVARRWLEVTGPFAWELMGAWDRPALVGLGYLHHVDVDGAICLRGGRTGEYAYDLLVAPDRAEDVLASLSRAGEPLDARRVGPAVVRLAALENWFWVPGHPGFAGLDPLQLQLQWRLSWEKDFPGAEALRARRGEGRRLVAFRTEGAPVEGAVVALGGEPVGEVRVVLPDGAGYALIDREWAHPGVPGLSCEGAPLALVSPPLVVNRSLFVKPQRHRYATRGEIGR